TLTWVYGPRLNPPWEQQVTHPALVLLALAFGAVCLVATALLAGPGPEAVGVGVVVAGAIVLAAIFVGALASGYFTRLVVTSKRLVVLQGYELVRSWSINDLPRSLIRYRYLAGGQEDRTVDLDALKTMLGSVSDKVAEAKTIMTFSKHLDRIKSREDGQP